MGLLFDFLTSGCLLSVVLVTASLSHVYIVFFFFFGRMGMNLVTLQSQPDSSASFYLELLNFLCNERDYFCFLIHLLLGAAYENRLVCVIHACV